MTEVKHPPESDLDTTPHEPVTEAARPTSDTIRASWNFSLDRMRQDMAHYPTESQEALIALFRWCIDDRHPMRRRDAAARLGCSENLLYQLYTGVYRNPDKSPRAPTAELIKRINEFLALEQERYVAGETKFVMTPTAKKIRTTCELARESRTMVILYGPSHIGKTWALEYHAAEVNHGRTVYCRLQAASGLGGMVRCIASACGISDKSNTADLIERIKRALNPQMLLILDECHLLAYTYRKGSFHNCMEVIREIHDVTKCGIVLCFTHLDNVSAASQKELQQVWRRGVHKVPLPTMPTKADIGCILYHSGLSGDPLKDDGREIPECVFPPRDLQVTVPAKPPITESPYEVLRQVAKRDGLLAITERLRYARKLAARSGAKISWRAFIDAHLRIEKQSQQQAEWN